MPRQRPQARAALLRGAQMHTHTSPPADRLQPAYLDVCNVYVFDTCKCVYLEMLRSGVRVHSRSGRRLKRPVALAVGCLLLLQTAMMVGTLASEAGAAPLRHPAPSVIHDYIVSLTPRALLVESYLRISPELVPQVYRQIDTDHDGSTSDAERDAWFREHPAKLRITLDGEEIQPLISPAPALRLEHLLMSMQRPVLVTYTYVFPSPMQGKHRIGLIYGDNYLPYDEYYVSVAGEPSSDGKPVNISRPQYPATYRIVYQIPAPTTGERGALPAGQLAPAPPSSGTTLPSVSDRDQPIGSPAPGSAAGAGGSGPQPSYNADILNALGNWRGELWSALGMLMLALGLGALHALTPGHGKAMVAAYLIGSRGRVRDAALLGGVVTFTHTAGVVALGVVLLVVSSFTVPTTLRPALEMASGLLVAGLGLYLLVARSRELRASRYPPSSAGARRLQPAHASSLSGRYTDPLRHHDHSHEHGHHDHHGHHEHEHAGVHTHAHPDGGGVGALIGLGVSGGLVPCPDALAILLLAVSLGQFVLGLGLVISFSVGLAAVLIAIGVTLVKAKGALEKTRIVRSGARFGPALSRWVPLASACVVVVVGALMLLEACGSLLS